MSVLLVVNTPPYGSEGPYNAFRLASLEQMLVEPLERAVDVTCCGTCCSTRGLTEEGLIPSVRVATIHDLAAAISRSAKVISF